MRLHLILAALLAAFFVVGCSSEKSIAPKVLASAGPQPKPVQPSHEEASAPEPQADPPPTPTASLPPKGQEPAEDKDKPATRPDPWAGLEAERVPYYQQLCDMLEPVGDAARDAVKAGFQLELSEDEKRAKEEVVLGQWKLPFSREEETALRALVAEVEHAASAAEDYLTAVDSLLASPKKGEIFAAAYERAIDEGADVSADVRKKLVELIKSSNPDPLQDVLASLLQELEDIRNSIVGEDTTDLRTRLLGQNVYASDVFGLAWHIHNLGESVIKKRERCRTFYDLVMALPEPHRSDVLMKVAWSPEREADLDREREKLKEVKLSHVNHGTVMMRSENRFWCESLLARERRAIAADRHQRLLALEQKRRDTIEGCFHHVDALGWEALKAVDRVVPRLQNVLEESIPKDPTERLENKGRKPGFEINSKRYQFRPFIPSDASWHALPKIPLPGSVEDRIPTIRFNDDFEIVFDPPAKPRTRTVASLTDRPPPPQDPYAGVDATWSPSYEQFKELLEPSVTASGPKVQGGAERHVSEDEEKKLAVVQLGQYKVSLNREAERRLRALLADIKSTETEAHGTKYIAAVDALIAGPAKARILAAAYEQAMNDGADIPADLRQKLAELIRTNDPQGQHARGPSYATGNIAQKAEAIQTKLPQQFVAGNDFLRLALSVYALGQSVSERRTLCRTFRPGDGPPRATPERRLDEACLEPRARSRP